MRSPPKVFSLWEGKPFISRFKSIEAMAEEDVFIPCRAYDVLLPIIPKREYLLNIFEESILKLINLSITSPERIAELMCFEIDMIQFIRAKLIRQGYVESDGTITSSGKSYLSELLRLKSAVEYTSARLFFEIHSGEICPYISFGETIYESAYFIGGGRIEVSFGSAGESVYRRGYRVKAKIANANIKPPTENRIRKAIARYNRIASAQKSVSSVKVNPENAINISPSGEEVFVHHKLVMQRGKVENILVSDGFMISNESVLEFIKTNEVDVITKFFERAAKKFSEKNEEKENKRHFRKDKYYEIRKLLTGIRYGGENLDEIKKIESFNNNKLFDYYSAIEWALLSYLELNPAYEAIISIYSNPHNSSEDNMNITIGYAKELGIAKAKQFSFLFKVHYGNIQGYKSGRPPSLSTVLSLAIAEAKYNPNSSLHRIIREFVDFLTYIANLKRMRDSQIHGGGCKTIYKTEDIEEMYNETHRFINLLLPDYSEHEKKESYSIEKEDASQEIVDADVALTNELDYSFYYHQLNNEQRDLLRRISPNKSESGIPEPYEYVNVLAEILESFLHNCIAELSQAGETAQIISKDVVITKMLGSYGKCPKSLSTVKINFYNSALKGNVSTLGGYTLAIFAFIEDTTIFPIEDCEQIISVIDEVLTLRGHGNNIALSKDIKSLDDLRKRVLEAIKIIGRIV